MEKLLNIGFRFTEKNVLRGLAGSFLFSPKCSGLRGCVLVLPAR